uniref:Uncharacterized protein n=1 Tax=Setaria italica TaxID=4555 RepID=K4AH48_SETIT
MNFTRFCSTFYEELDLAATLISDAPNNFWKNLSGFDIILWGKCESRLLAFVRNSELVTTSTILSVVFLTNAAFVGSNMISFDTFLPSCLSHPAAQLTT